MTKTDELLKEFAQKWGFEYVESGGFAGYVQTNNAENNCTSDLRMLIDKLMPTDKQGQEISFRRYPNHGTDTTQEKQQAAFFLGWRMALDEMRNRMKE